MSNSPPQKIGWNIPTSSQGFNSPNSNTQTQQFGGNHLPYVSSSPPGQYDPFANLPTPIPVPIQGKGSQSSGGGSSGHGKFSPPTGGFQSQYLNIVNDTGGNNRGQKDYNKNKPTSSEKGNNPSSFGSPSKSQPKLQHVVRHPSDLDVFGKFEFVTNSDEKFKMIKRYVKNSHGFKEGQGGVKVHGVYEISSSIWKTFLNNLSSLGGTSSDKLLLWYKTTPKGLQLLASKTTGCVAFYDRVCRAFPENPKHMQKPSRQIIVLCAVSLGRGQRSPIGFQHWSKIGGAPPGFDTVKGMGKFVPDFEKSVIDDTFFVPSGHTKPHGKYKHYELDFNEYIVFDSGRIKVKYAVDLEIFPS